MSLLRTMSLCILAELGLAAAASAQNLLTNPDFDDGLGLTLWTTNQGSWVLGADSGSCLLSDSAEGTSADVGGLQIVGMRSAQCIPVDPVATPTLYLGALYKSAANVYARLYVQFFSGGTCATHDSWSATVFASISPNWNSILGPITISPTAGSAKVWAEYVPTSPAEPQYNGSYDRIYLGVLPWTFVDGFEAESGSACHWSSIVGGI
jgi:hypothetical protein